MLQWYDGVSDEEAAARAKFGLRWKVALSIELENVQFAKSTLQLFRAQLLVHQQMKQLFEASLRHARAQGYFKSRSINVALDTTPIFGRGAVEDTYNLLAESLRQVLRVLASVEKQSVETFAEEHDFRRYMAASFKGTVAINWDKESERQTVLTSLVADCDRALALVRSALTAHADDAAAVMRL